MGRKKKKQEIVDKVDISQIDELQQQYLNELNSNPEYSLSVDPTNKYDMTEEQKLFTEYYVQFKNVNAAAQFAAIDQEVALQYFVSYPVQQEIRRINRALYHRQFNNKMLSLDDIGGYLTSLITDENVPLADQLKTQDKLRVASMLIDLTKLKQESMSDPSVIVVKDIDAQIKNLSVKTISQLLAQTETENEQTIDVIDNDTLTPEEKDYLKTLPTQDLLQMIEDTNNKGGAK